MQQAHCRSSRPLPAGERAALFCDIEEWVRGVGSISTASSPLTPPLSPNGKREHTEAAGAYQGGTTMLLGRGQTEFAARAEHARHEHGRARLSLLTAVPAPA